MNLCEIMKLRCLKTMIIITSYNFNNFFPSYDNVIIDHEIIIISILKRFNILKKTKKLFIWVLGSTQIVLFSEMLKF
jgi:hypothetical protein